jgi:hypothetical protein
MARQRHAQVGRTTESLRVATVGKTRGPYKEEFQKGSKVQIADRATLDKFVATWAYHHKLEPTQLEYESCIAEVVSVAFYHGGDELYELKGIPGIWHEQCLRGV